VARRACAPGAGGRDLLRLGATAAAQPALRLGGDPVLWGQNSPALPSRPIRTCCAMSAAAGRSPTRARGTRLIQDDLGTGTSSTPSATPRRIRLAACQTTRGAPDWRRLISQAAMA
jgi:hypothetical protein